MSRNLAHTSIFVSIILLCGYAISFIKEIVIANFFGISADIDAYTIAITVPVNLFAIVALSIQPVIIPIYSKLLYNENVERANAYISSFINILLIGSLILLLLFELLASPIIYLFAPGLTADSHTLAVSLLRITLPTVVFTLIDRILVGVLNIHKSFVLPALSVYFLNLSIILFLLRFHHQWGIEAACIGQVIGSILQVFFLTFIIRKHYKYSLVLNYKDVSIKETYKNVLPVMWSTSLAEIDAIVNRAVASSLFVGAISALGYASKVKSVFFLLFTSAIATIVYPLYAESSAKQNMQQLNSRVNTTLSAYTFFLLPLMIGIVCLKSEIIEVLFARGKFNMNDVKLTQGILGYYSIGILFLAFRETLTKVFYSLHDTHTPAKNATLGFCINIILNLTLPFIWGVNGLAIATSITAIFISIRLLIKLLKEYPQIQLNYFMSNIKNLILPTIIMALIIIILRNYLQIPSILMILICGALSAISYISISLIVRVPIVWKIINMLMKKG